MTANPTLCIIGNCQAQALESLAHHLGAPVNIVHTPPIFDLEQFHTPQIEHAVRTADFVMNQRVSEDYVVEFARPTELRRLIGERAISWPNIYFDGYFPTIGYIYLSGGKLTGPLSDYHFPPIRRAWEEGVSVEQAAAQFEDGSLPGLPANPAERSLDMLREREQGLDCSISDYVATHFRWRKIFYAMNHPHDEVLYEMLRRLLQQIGITLDNKAVVPSHPYSLNGIDIPPLGYVREKYGICSEILDIKGRDITISPEYSGELSSETHYNWQECIEKYYTLYDSVLVKS